MCLSSINNRLLLVCFLLLGIMVGCAPPIEDATETANRFLYAKFHGEYASMEAYISQRSRTQYTQLKQLDIQDMGESYKPPTYNLLRTEAEDEQAYVYYQIEGFGEDRVQLVVESGKWKVVLPEAFK